MNRQKTRENAVFFGTALRHTVLLSRCGGPSSAYPHKSEVFDLAGRKGRARGATLYPSASPPFHRRRSHRRRSRIGEPGDAPPSRLRPCRQAGPRGQAYKASSIGVTAFPALANRAEEKALWRAWNRFRHMRPKYSVTRAGRCARKGRHSIHRHHLPQRGSCALPRPAQSGGA